MKKILVLLLLSSPLLTMELSYKRHASRSQFTHIASSLIKTHKTKDFYRTFPDNASIISHEVNARKVLIDASSIRAPHSLSDAKLYHTTEGFVVQHADKQHVIEKRFMDPIGGAPLCAKVTGAALATGTSGTGIVAGIEALSLAVGLFFGLTPTP